MLFRSPPSPSVHRLLWHEEVVPVLVDNVARGLETRLDDSKDVDAEPSNKLTIAAERPDVRADDDDGVGCSDEINDESH